MEVFSLSHNLERGAKQGGIEYNDKNKTIYLNTYKRLLGIQLNIKYIWIWGRVENAVKDLALNLDLFIWLNSIFHQSKGFTVHTCKKKNNPPINLVHHL